MFEFYDESQAAEPAPKQPSRQSSKRKPFFRVKGRGAARGYESGMTKPWQQDIKPWVNLLYILLLIAIFFVCLWNIGPYEVAVRFIAAKFEASALVDFMLNFPLLGWILRWLGDALFWLIGAVVWSVIQLIELMPMIMVHQPGYVRSVLNRYEASPKVRPRSDDPGVVRYLKKFYNLLPIRFLILARRLRGVVYVVDMCIVMAVYPPCDGGIGRFFFLLGTGQWGRLDWANILLMLITLFAVEAIFKIILIVNHFRLYLKESKPEATAAS